MPFFFVYAGNKGFGVRTHVLSADIGRTQVGTGKRCREKRTPLTTFSIDRLSIKREYAYFCDGKKEVSSPARRAAPKKKKERAMSPILSAYIVFLRWCLAEGSIEDILPTAKGICWHDLLEFAKKQSLVGVFYGGILRLGQMTTNKPTDDDVMEWMAVANKIRKRNEQMFERAAFVHRTFLSEGFRNCLLKGQGNALMYPDPMMRTPGDIDIWVEGGDRKAIKYVRRISPDAKICYHHIDFKKVKGVEVEVHYRPSFMNNLRANRRLQAFFNEHAGRQFNNEVKGPNGVDAFSVPTWDFNVVFQLCHIANHFFNEGVGLRQIVDYYYLLSQRQGEDRRAELRQLGLSRVAGAVMYVERNYLGLAQEHLVSDEDRRRGEMLMKEIMAGGNFGQYDERLLSGVYNNKVLKNVQRLVRDVRLALLFPSESLWEPVFRWWHFFWRRKMNKLASTDAQ